MLMTRNATFATHVTFMIVPAGGGVVNTATSVPRPIAATVGARSSIVSEFRVGYALGRLQLALDVEPAAPGALVQHLGHALAVDRVAAVQHAHGLRVMITSA